MGGRICTARAVKFHRMVHGFNGSMTDQRGSIRYNPSSIR